MSVMIILFFQKGLGCISLCGITILSCISLSGTASFFYENMFDIHFLSAFPEMGKQIAIPFRKFKAYRGTGNHFRYFAEGWGLHIVKSYRSEILLLKRI